MERRDSGNAKENDQGCLARIEAPAVWQGEKKRGCQKATIEVRAEKKNHVEISGSRFKGLKTAARTRPIDQREKN